MEEIIRHRPDFGALESGPSRKATGVGDNSGADGFFAVDRVSVAAAVSMDCYVRRFIRPIRPNCLRR